MKITFLKHISTGLRSISAASVLVAGFAGGAVLQSATEAEAATRTISCPVDKARREVTTALPDGWWSTPIVSSLRSTEVIEIGGRTALQCKYGGAGNIQRYAPERFTCEARPGGFRCASIAAPRPQTFSTGEVNIPQTYLADLDRGRVGSAGADIWFQAETRDLLYLVPRNGAQIGVGDRSNRGYQGCSTARYTSARVSLRDIPVGSYVCVKTNKGRISQFRVNRISGGSPKTLTIGYTTFK